eukprot:6174721-Pleurochrysis_carterae.AAC.1
MPPSWGRVAAQAEQDGARASRGRLPTRPTDQSLMYRSYRGSELARAGDLTSRQRPGGARRTYPVGNMPDWR